MMKSSVSAMLRKLSGPVFALACVVTQTVSAAVFDGGVDSANLGKGDWIYYVSAATNKLGGNVPSVTNIPTLMSYFSSQGIRYIIVKAGTGSTNFNGGGTSPQFNTALVNAAHAAGLKIFGYTRSYGSDVPGEIAIADYVFNCGADGFVLDAEAEWESYQPWIGSNGPALATQLCSGIKSRWPTKFLGHSPMPIISYHSSFPYKEFGYYCDTVMPQIYHFSFNMTPSAAIDWSDREWRAWQNSLTGVWTNAIKPLAPVGQVYGPLAPPAAPTVPDQDVTEFIDYLSCDPNCVTAGGYKGVNFWRADLHGAVQWANIKAATIGNFPGIVNNIVFDNPGATVAGTWSSGTASTNRFGTNYIYKGQGTGAAYVQFNPNITAAGDYEVFEWHTVGSNRSTNTPHVIAYNGGTVTVGVNQQANDARWNSLGTYNFAAGTGGYLRIQDNIPDTGKIAVADGIKFVFIRSTAMPPNAPSNLAATPSRSTRIDLAWTDNSGDENGFRVERSTDNVNFTQFISVGANITSTYDSGLTPNTTYYYRVRAFNDGGNSAYSATASAATYETDLLVDNKSALVAGTNWSSGTSSTDKYGADYRFSNQGTGANYVKFTPYVATAGAYEVYEWHPQGSNRTTNAPHVITHSGGTTTVYANQKTNGGKWNLLGVFNFAVGNIGNVKITDGFPDGTQVVMADAIKLVPAPLPAAPGGLTATAATAWRINLAWTDNATNETEYIVARATVSGGPYTDIATLPANTTSYISTNLAPNTAYYYVVRARNGSGVSANSGQAAATTYKAVHVNSITMSWVSASGKYRSRATVNVKDSAGANVNAATVTGNFTGAIVESGKTGVTGTTGNATITSTASISTGTVTFTVTGITGTAMSYNPSANVVTSKTHSR